MATRVYWNPVPFRTRLILAHSPAALRTGQVAQQLAPRGRTGALARGTRAILAGAQRAVLGAFGVLHAVPVIRGQRPHVIEPSQARALTTPFGLKARVQHPGARGNDYIRKAATTYPVAYRLEARRRIR